MRGFGSDVARHKPVRGATKAAVGEESNGVAEPCPDQCSRNGEHFAHARAAFWSLVANHDDVTSFDFIFVDFSESGFFTVEHASRATEIHGVVAGNFYDAAFGSEIAFQDDEAASWLKRIFRLAHDFLFGFFFRSVGFLS